MRSVGHEIDRVKAVRLTATAPPLSNHFGFAPFFIGLGDRCQSWVGGGAIRFPAAFRFSLAPSGRKRTFLAQVLFCQLVVDFRFRTPLTPPAPPETNFPPPPPWPGRHTDPAFLSPPINGATPTTSHSWQ